MGSRDLNCQNFLEHLKVRPRRNFGRRFQKTSKFQRNLNCQESYGHFKILIFTDKKVKKKSEIKSQNLNFLLKSTGIL